MPQREYGTFRRVFGRFSGARTGEPSVHAGDRFFERSPLASVWVVDRIVQPRGVGIPHVVIRHQQVHSERRLVAKSLLLDPERFGRDRRNSAAQVRTGAPRRRRSDAPASPRVARTAREAEPSFAR